MGKQFAYNLNKLVAIPYNIYITTMNKQFFSASQIADFVYCARSFYLKRKLGIGNLDSQDIKDGLLYHDRHGFKIATYNFLKKLILLIFFILVVALLLFIFYAIAQNVNTKLGV